MKKPATKKEERRGRPSDYTPELASIICDRLAAGDSLRKICSPDDMPDESTVRKWAAENRAGFYPHYARAREAQMDALAEDILEIADEKDIDVQRSRLRVDTRKWLMSKIAPKRFGDRKTHELTGAGGGPIQTVDLTKASDEQLAALEAIFGPLARSGDDDEGDPGGEGETA